MGEKQLRVARNIAVGVTAILGILVGLTWLGDRADLFDGVVALEILAGLTALGGVSIGFFYSIEPKDAADSAQAAAKTRYKNFEMILVFFVAFCGVMIGFVDSPAAQSTFIVLASVGGIAIGAAAIFGRVAGKS